MARTERVEIRPADVQWYEEIDPEGNVWTDEPPPAHRPHFLRKVAANGEPEWHTENFANRANARRASKRHARAYGCRVVEFDTNGDPR